MPDEELGYTDHSVLPGVVMEQIPMSIPVLWPNPAYAQQYPFQNPFVAFRIDGCTRGKKFTMDQTLTVEKDDQQHVDDDQQRGFWQTTFLEGG